MPLDDYAAVGGGGALRLKGAKVTKSKKKKKKDKAGLEKALSEASGEALALVKKDDGDEVVEKKSKKSRKGGDEEEDDEEGVPVARKTEAQRKLDEVRRKRVSWLPRSVNQQMVGLNFA